MNEGIVPVLTASLIRASTGRRGILLPADFKDAGVSNRSVRRMANKGLVLAPYKDVFVNPSVPPSWEQAILVACLGLRAIAGRRSAARLWGLLPDDDTVEVAVPSRRRVVAPGVIVFRCSDLATYRPVIRYGIPTMHPLQMLVHLGAVVDHLTLRNVVARGIVKKLFTLPGAVAALGRLGKPGRDGTTALRLVLAGFRTADSAAESVLEMLFHFLCREAGLPEPVYQHWIDELRIRLDAAYPEWMIAIEIDGFESRGTAEALSYDDARQNRIVLQGWLILRFTWDRIENDPAGVAAEIRIALADRGADL